MYWEAPRSDWLVWRQIGPWRRSLHLNSFLSVSCPWMKHWCRLIAPPLCSALSSECNAPPAAVCGCARSLNSPFSRIVKKKEITVCNSALSAELLWVFTSWLDLIGTLMFETFCRDGTLWTLIPEPLTLNPDPWTLNPETLQHCLISHPWPSGSPLEISGPVYASADIYLWSLFTLEPENNTCRASRWR